ncbi:MAG: enoyl-CoA hydratase [Enterobacteriaceae bacterium]
MCYELKYLHMMYQYEHLCITQPAEGVILVQLNRPEVRNTLNQTLRHSLANAFTQLSLDSHVRCIVLSGGDKVFAAGADLNEFRNINTVDMYLRHTNLLWKAIADCTKPIIAAVNGYALGGGCELAMHADIIIAGRHAHFAQPEIKLGIMPGAGGTQRLTRAIGKYQAMKMLLTGDVISGEDAFAMGLVSEVTEDEQVQQRALELAITIASRPPVAAEQIKEVLLAGQDMSLSSALALEQKAFCLLFSTEDQKEGLEAFFAKRQPEYRGR